MRQAQSYLRAHASCRGEQDEEQQVFAAMGSGFIGWLLNSVAEVKGQNQAGISADCYLEWQFLLEHLFFARSGREICWKM